MSCVCILRPGGVSCLVIYVKLFKILIEVKRSLLFRIAEFPSNMHIYAYKLYRDVCKVTDLYH